MYNQVSGFISAWCRQCVVSSVSETGGIVRSKQMQWKVELGDQNKLHAVGRRNGYDEKNQSQNGDHEKPDNW